MPRGFKKAIAATRLARFADDRSFVSQVKRIPNGCPNEAHLLLYGAADKGVIRAEIFKRNREKFTLAGVPVNRCEICGSRVFEHEEWRRGHWHHIHNKPGMRCDCPENGCVLCEDCHSEQHLKPKFGPAADVKLIGGDSEM